MKLQHPKVRIRGKNWVGQWRDEHLKKRFHVLGSRHELERTEIVVGVNRDRSDL